MAEYEITISNLKRLYDWISIQPNLVTIQPFSPDKIYCEFNHDATQQAQFKEDVIARLAEVDIGNNTFELLLPHIKQIKTDQSLFSMTPRLQITNLPTTFSDLFPALYNGFPIPIHTLGYTKMGFVLLWNKNGGTSNHDLRLVKCDNSGNLLPNAGSPDILIQGTNIPSGRTTNFDFNIPTPFLDFRGFVKIQGKSVNGTDDPILDAFFVYLIR